MWKSDWGRWRGYNGRETRKWGFQTLQKSFRSINTFFLISHKWEGKKKYKQPVSIGQQWTLVMVRNLKITLFWGEGRGVVFS